jgi:hypothetical protein
LRVHLFLPVSAPSRIFLRGSHFIPISVIINKKVPWELHEEEGNFMIITNELSKISLEMDILKMDIQEGDLCGSYSSAGQGLSAQGVRK